MSSSSSNMSADTVLFGNGGKCNLSSNWRTNGSLDIPFGKMHLNCLGSVVQPDTTYVVGVGTDNELKLVANGGGSGVVTGGILTANITTAGTAWAVGQIGSVSSTGGGTGAAYTVTAISGTGATSTLVSVNYTTVGTGYAVNDLIELINTTTGGTNALATVTAITSGGGSGDELLKTTGADPQMVSNKIELSTDGGLTLNRTLNFNKGTTGAGNVIGIMGYIEAAASSTGTNAFNFLKGPAPSADLPEAFVCDFIRPLGTPTTGTQQIVTYNETTGELQHKDEPSAGIGDVTLAGNNQFTGLNTSAQTWIFNSLTPATVPSVEFQNGPRCNGLHLETVKANQQTVLITSNLSIPGTGTRMVETSTLSTELIKNNFAGATNLQQDLALMNQATAQNTVDIMGRLITGNINYTPSLQEVYGQIQFRNSSGTIINSDMTLTNLSQQNQCQVGYRTATGGSAHIGTGHMILTSINNTGATNDVQALVCDFIRNANGDTLPASPQILYYDTTSHELTYRTFTGGGGGSGDALLTPSTSQPGGINTPGPQTFKGYNMFDGTSGTAVTTGGSWLTVVNDQGTIATGYPLTAMSLHGVKPTNGAGGISTPSVKIGAFPTISNATPSLMNFGVYGGVFCDLFTNAAITNPLGDNDFMFDGHYGHTTNHNILRSKQQTQQTIDSEFIIQVQDAHMYDFIAADSIANPTVFNTFRFRTIQPGRPSGLIQEETIFQTEGTFNKFRNVGIQGSTPTHGVHLDFETDHVIASEHDIEHQSSLTFTKSGSIVTPAIGRLSYWSEDPDPVRGLLTSRQDLRVWSRVKAQLTPEPPVIPVLTVLRITNEIDTSLTTFPTNSWGKQQILFDHFDSVANTGPNPATPQEGKLEYGATMLFPLGGTSYGGFSMNASLAVEHSLTVGDLTDNNDQHYIQYWSMRGTNILGTDANGLIVAGDTSELVSKVTANTLAGNGAVAVDTEFTDCKVTVAGVTAGAGLFIGNGLGGIQEKQITTALTITDWHPILGGINTTLFSASVTNPPEFKVEEFNSMYPHLTTRYHVTFRGAVEVIAPIQQSTPAAPGVPIPVVTGSTNSPSIPAPAVTQTYPVPYKAAIGTATVTSGGYLMNSTMEMTSASNTLHMSPVVGVIMGWNPATNTPVLDEGALDVGCIYYLDSINYWTDGQSIIPPLP